MMDQRKVLERNKLVEMYSGSIAYGTNLPTSDVDIRGVFVAEPISVRTPFFPVDEVEIPGGDTKFYELNKFMKLLIDQNPNIVELAWVNGQDIISSSAGYELIRQSRGQLLTSKIAATTSGYAHSQLLRIKGHKKWIMNPQPVNQPERKDFVSVVFNFTKKTEYNKHVPFNDFSAFDIGDNHFSLYEDTGNTWISPQGGFIHRSKTYFTSTPSSVSAKLLQVLTNKRRTPAIIVKFNEKQFKEALENWKSYWEWKNNRNEKRAELELKFSYDTKHAMHLVRLLRMGYEALTEGLVRVRRPDAQELLSIRNGAWSYEQVIEYAEFMKEEVDKAVKLKNLPDSVNFHQVGKLMMHVQDSIWTY